MRQKSQVTHGLFYLWIEVFFLKHIIKFNIDEVSERLDHGMQADIFKMVTVNLIWSTNKNTLCFISHFDSNHVNLIFNSIRITFCCFHVFGNIDVCKLNCEMSILTLFCKLIAQKVIHVLVSIDVFVGLRVDIVYIFSPCPVENVVGSWRILNIHKYHSVDKASLFAIVGGTESYWNTNKLFICRIREHLTFQVVKI